MTSDFEKLIAKKDLYVLACERDPFEYGRPIVCEQILDCGAASLKSIKAFRKALGERFGATRIAKLEFIDDDNQETNDAVGK